MGDREGESEKALNCVTSFMNAPYHFIIVFIDDVNFPDRSNQLTRSNKSGMSVVTTESFEGQKSRILPVKKSR